MARVVIIGAGWGGQGVCKALSEASLPADTSVTCIDSASSLEVGATWQFELEGRAKPVAVALAESVAAPYLKKGRVASVEYDDKVITLDGGETVAYDHLVLACGAVSDASSVPGLAEHAVDLSTRGFAAPIAAFVDGLAPGAETKKTVLVAVAKTPYKCPPLPFEVAFLLDAMARKRGARDALDIVVTCPVPWPFGGPKAKEAFTAAMRDKGISYRPNLSVTRVDGGATKVAYYAPPADGAGPVEPVAADLVLAVFPHRAPDFVDAALLNPKGSIPVDFRTNRVTKGDHIDLYAVGDACAAMLPLETPTPIPKAGEFAYKAGLAVGQALAAEINGDDVPVPKARSAKCVAEAGGGAGIVVGPNFDAIFADPANGKPKFIIEPSVGGTTDKVAWIQGFLDTFHSGTAPTFAPVVA